MTKSTKEMSKELHDWLKRDGECWHEPNESAVFSSTERRCLKCFIGSCDNPDFFSPATEDQAAVNFFWLLTRAVEKHIGALSEWRARIYWRNEYDLISCTELAKALYEFKEERKNG